MEKKITEGELKSLVRSVTNKMLCEGAFDEDVEEGGVSDEIFEVVHKFVMWCFNYDRSLHWIDRIWGDDPYLADHIKGIFKECESMGGYGGAMPLFFCEVDDGCQHKIIDYIMHNYRG